MEGTLKLLVAGTELAFHAPEDDKYIRGIVNEFNSDVSEMQINHASATKLEAILMCALDYLDRVKQLEAELKRK